MLFSLSLFQFALARPQQTQHGNMHFLFCGFLSLSLSLSIRKVCVFMCTPHTHAHTHALARLQQKQNQSKIEIINQSTTCCCFFGFYWLFLLFSLSLSLSLASPLSSSRLAQTFGWTNRHWQPTATNVLVFDQATSTQPLEHMAASQQSVGIRT